MKTPTQKHRHHHLRRAQVTGPPPPPGRREPRLSQPALTHSIKMLIESCQSAYKQHDMTYCHYAGGGGGGGGGGVRIGGGGVLGSLFPHRPRAYPDPDAV
uniref:Uncharacterized protein n=1 Tax=Knipowitschia caucasica TaxID=637954 RepID=A0AAV2LW77_KNICA